MKILAFASVICISLTLSAQDDFWSSSAPLQSHTETIGFHSSGAVGLYGSRDASLIDVGQDSNRSIKEQMTNWEKLWAQGEIELQKYVEKEVKKFVKNEIKKAVGDEMGKSIGNQYGGVAGDLAGNILFGNPDKEAAEAERQAKLEQERIAKQQQELMKKYQAEFKSLLTDANLSVVPLIPQTLVFIVNLEENNGVSFSLFNLQPNGYGELPYKIDVMKDYQQKTGKTNSYLYGSFKTVESAREEIKKVAFMAFLGFHEVKEDVVFNYTNGQKESPTNHSSDDSFWGTTKKN